MLISAYVVVGNTSVCLRMSTQHVTNYMYIKTCSLFIINLQSQLEMMSAASPAPATHIVALMGITPTPISKQ